MKNHSEFDDEPYDLYVPGNYAHRVVSPANNKFLAIYRDPYGALGYQVNFSTGPNGSGGSDLGTHYYENGVEGRVIYPASARSFLTAADAGKWRRIVVHMKTPTTPTNLRRLP